MRVLSAIDAIQPAWDHARRITIAPRSWRLAFKITALAFFARVGGCGGNYSQMGGQHSHHLPPAVSAALMGVFVLLAIVGLMLGLAFFYLNSRLQFVLLDSVLRRDTVIAPIWRRYGRATWYWIWLKVAFFVVALACLSPLLVPGMLSFVHAMRAGHGSAHPGAFVGAILGLLGALFVVMLIVGTGYTLLMDFGLPSMALEGTSLGETVARVWRLLRGETGQVLLYLLMRFVLGIAASMSGLLAALIAALVAAIPLGGLGGLMWMSLRHAGTSGHVLMVAILAALGVVFLAAMTVAVIMLFGYAQVFFQAYALYFLGGRYPAVGVYLEPFVPQPFGWANPIPAPPVPDQGFGA